MLRHPYLSTFYAVIIKLAQWHHDIGITAPVEYVFDDQGAVGEDAVIWYKHIKIGQRPEVANLMGGTPRFENDQLVLPLQAADMLAWHVRRRKDYPREDESRWPTVPLADLTYAEVHLSKELLISVAEQMKQVPGIEQVQHKPRKYSRRKFHEIVRSSPPQHKNE